MLFILLSLLFCAHAMCMENNTIATTQITFEQKPLDIDRQDDKLVIAHTYKKYSDPSVTVVSLTDPTFKKQCWVNQVATVRFCNNKIVCGDYTGKITILKDNAAQNLEQLYSFRVDDEFTIPNLYPVDENNLCIVTKKSISTYNIENKTPQSLYVTPPNEPDILCSSLSHDKKCMAFGTKSIINILNFETKQHIPLIELSAVQFLNALGKLLSRRINPEAKSGPIIEPSDNPAIKALAWSSNNQYLLAATVLGCIKKWNFNEKKLEKEIATHSDIIGSLDIHSNDKDIVITDQKAITLYDQQNENFSFVADNKNRNFLRFLEDTLIYHQDGTIFFKKISDFTDTKS